jgi:protein-S-isoprenylcysteine O-methyltransferase Ste14
MNHLKSLTLNLGILSFSLLLIFLAEKVNLFFELPNFQSPITIAFGLLLIALGTIIRTWASLTFYKHQLRIICLNAQQTLVQEGPYALSRNPLYIGIFTIQFGAVLLMGSLMGLVFSIIYFIFWDVCLHVYEEKQIEKQFGEMVEN